MQDDIYKIGAKNVKNRKVHQNIKMHLYLLNKGFSACRKC